MAQAAPRNTAAAMNATWKPDTRAAAADKGVTGPCRRLVVRFAASVERIANPIEPPTCWAVLSRPDARPGVLSADVTRAGQRDRDECPPHAETQREEAREYVGCVVPMHRKLGEDDHPGGRERGVNVETEFANVLRIRDGKVMRLCLYSNRDRAFADLGLGPDGGSAAS
jgi:hypothetical protein